MGMFDYIVCEVELPGNPPEGLSFQTKSLPRTMATYTITKEGRLLKTRYKRVRLRQGEVPHYTRFWSRMQPIVEHPLMRTIHLKREALDIDHHGDIIFYDYLGAGKWYEYKARFTNGQLEWIRKIDRNKW